MNNSCTSKKEHYIREELQVADVVGSRRPDGYDEEQHKVYRRQDRV